MNSAKKYRVRRDEHWTVEITERRRDGEFVYYAKAFNDYGDEVSFMAAETRERAESYALRCLQRKGKVTEV